MQPHPFLKWAGGKSRIANAIAKVFPERFERYFEPFLGSGAVYFKIAPQHGFLNDLNPFLIGAYEAIKEFPEELMILLNHLEEVYNGLANLDEKNVFYYQIRDDYNGIPEPNLRKSANFIFLNKAGWNGMYRENADGDFNIPFGRHERIKLYDYDNIMTISRNIQDMHFTSGDYKESLKNAKSGDLIYLDPPYFPTSKTASFTAYQKEGFGDREQEELFKVAEELSSKGCYIVISNSDTEKSHKLYGANSDFHIRPMPIMRTIGSKISSRKVVNEILVTNFEVKCNDGS